MQRKMAPSAAWRSRPSRKTFASNPARATIAWQRSRVCSGEIKKAVCESGLSLRCRDLLLGGREVAAARAHVVLLVVDGDLDGVIAAVGHEISGVVADGVLAAQLILDL